MNQPHSIADERWLPIPGWEGYYEASNQGRVRGLDRWVSAAEGHGSYAIKGRILRPQVDRAGYEWVTLSRMGEHRRQVAHLVLEAFVGLCPEGLQCCHWDDVPLNNNLTNLRWDTYEANRQDAIRNGKKSNNLNKTECPRQHPYSPENTYVHPNGRGGRICRTCTYEANKARRLAKSQAVSA